MMRNKPVNLFVVMLLLTVLSLVLSVTLSAQTEPTPHGQIIFIRHSEQSGHDILAISPDGSQTRNLTQSPTIREDSTSCSPDGESIAYISEQDGSPDIYTMQLTNGQQQQLTDSDYNKEFALWIPGTQQLIFRILSHDFTIDVVTGELGHATETMLQHVIRAKSPDGQRIALAMDVDPDPDRARYELFIDDENGRQQITDDSYDNVRPAWSPDGEQLVFVRYDQNRHGHLAIVRADGSDLRMLTTGDGNDDWPCWSPHSIHSEVTSAAGSLPGRTNQSAAKPAGRSG